MTQRTRSALSLAFMLALGSAACGDDAPGDSDDTRDDGGTTPTDGAPGGDDAQIARDGGSPDPGDPDVNGDGRLDILVLGTSRSIRQANGGFSADGIASELQSILDGDASHGLTVNVVAEDIHATASVDVGLGQGGDIFSYTFQSHSLAQYYHWPEGRAARHENLGGEGDTDWDHVILGADPQIVSDTPGYYALGVNTIADRVREGGAEPRLLMVWPRDGADTSADHFEEHTYRTGDGAGIPTVAAGLAWNALSSAQRDTSAMHPSPNGAYVAAAAIYAQLFGQSASESGYTYDDEIADVAHATVESAFGAVHYEGLRTFGSPFAPAEITDRILNYDHTGTSSENGILAGLRWVLAKARVELVSGGDAPIDFNYGRANTNFEADKRYRVDPSAFEFSLGFPMQDNGNTGDESMLYGLDHRGDESENGTDLGVAFYMLDNDELPEARALPIRTLFAQMREANPDQSAYRDAWHMHRDLDKAVGAFIYTLLTGHCALDEEPADRSSAEWLSWMAHRIGYETAWTVMHLRGRAPGFRVLPDSEESLSVTPSTSAGLAVSFANAPTAEVVVRITTDNDDAVTVSPTELTFTPENYASPQMVTMTGRDGAAAEEIYTVSATTSSADADFDGFVDRWEYAVQRP